MCELMAARAIVIIAATTLLTACLNSERLRSNLGGPAAVANAEAPRAAALEQDRTANQLRRL
jgi:hypothetical protein